MLILQNVFQQIRGSLSSWVRNLIVQLIIVIISIRISGRVRKNFFFIFCSTTREFIIVKQIDWNYFIAVGTWAEQNLVERSYDYVDQNSSIS